MKELQSIIDAYREVEKKGKRATLATVVKVTGSAYRRAGARMMITADGQTVGNDSLSTAVTWGMSPINMGRRL